MVRRMRVGIGLIVGLVAGLGIAACSDSAGQRDGGRAGDGASSAADRGGASDGVSSAADHGASADGAVQNGGRCAAAGGRCECGCNAPFPIDAPEHNDCPQPCPQCGACSLFCCLPDPECDATAGCVKVCEGGVCDCQCPPAQTPCGGATCDRKREVCVGKGPVGPSVSYGCEPVPTGCEAARTCLCAGPQLCTATETCVEEGDNTLFCDNGTQ